MSKHTALYETHVQLGGCMVDFAGWEMPLHYGSQIQEHQQVRNSAGIFDVSHMGVVDIQGKQAIPFLLHLLSNDISKLAQNGQAFYTCMLNDAGGVVDDLIVYRINSDYFRAVINAGCRDKDIAWMKEQAKNFSIDITPKDLSIIAIQGPKVFQLTDAIFPKAWLPEIKSLKYFHFVKKNEVMIAYTGYTGEEGFEIIAPAEVIIKLWNDAIKSGIKPCGLGARDTLRLEAGLNLYGSDMDESTSPLISNLSWTVTCKDEQHNFIGKQALLNQKAQGIKEKLIGLVLEQGGVLRRGQIVLNQEGAQGVITSGTFSPTLNYSIALARVPINTAVEAKVERRGTWIPVKIVKPPFIEKRRQS